MENGSLPTVEVQKMNKSFVELRMDEKAMKDSKKIFERIARNHLSYLVRLQSDEINDDFPEDLPERLLWPGKSLFPAIKKRPMNSKVSLALVEADEFTANTPVQRQRRSRYSGTYNVEHLAATTSKLVMAKPIHSSRIRNESESSIISNSSKSSSSKSSNHSLILKISVPKTSRKISTSSSSSSASNSPLKGFTPRGKPLSEKLKALESSSSSSSESSSDDECTVKQKAQKTAPKQPKLMTASRQLAMNCPNTVNLNPKPFVKEAPVASFVIPQKKPDSKTAEPDAKKAVTPVKSKSTVPEKPNIFSKPKPIKTFGPPQIVEPPQMDPKTKKPITQEALDKQRLKKIPRIPKKVKGLEVLGGIFTVKNGWDKEEEPKIIPEQEMTNAIRFVIPKVIRAPPAQDSKPLVPESARKPRSPIRTPISTSFVKNTEVETSKTDTDKFNRHRDSDDSESDKDMTEEPSKTVSSSSSESEDEVVKPEIKTAPAIDSKRNQEKDSSSSSDKEQLDDQDNATSDQDSPLNLEDVILLDGDIDLDYDDDDDKDKSYEPAMSLAAKMAKSAPKVAPKPPVVPDENYTAELDELKLTLRKEELLPTTAPAAAAQSEFDRNTDAIIEKILPTVDAYTQRIFNQFFGNVCIGFLEDNCVSKQCKHFLPETQSVSHALERCSLKPVDEAFNVAIQYPKLLFTYFSQFVEQFVKKAFLPLKNESRLIRMLMECEKNARSHKLYHAIVDALVLTAKMPRYKAIKFIIEHHTDSTYARDVITQMILDTGSDLIRNISYLQHYAASQTVPTSIIDKILLNCVTYQDPALPTLCLDLLLNVQAKQMSEMCPESLQKFTYLQTELTSKNKEREMKLAEVLAVIVRTPKPRPPPVL